MTRFKLLPNLLLLAATLVLLFVLGEVYARIYFSRSIATNEALKIYEKSDVVGWEHRPGSTAEHGPTNTDGKRPQIRINNFGMRGPEVTKEKSVETVRVLMLGDSFTYGMITDQEKIFPYLLEKKFNKELGPKTGKKYEVLNFGVIGYTTDQEYLLLRERGLQFAPDIVVVNYFAGNDATEFRRHEWAKDASGKLEKVVDELHFVDENGELRRYGVGRPLSYFVAFVRERGRVLFDMLGIHLNRPLLLWSNFLPATHPQGDPEIFEYFEKAKEMLGAIKTLDDANGIKTLVAVIPADIQVGDRYLAKYPGNPWNDTGVDKTRPQEIIRKYTAELGIQTLDLLPIFSKDSNDIYFTENDPHFSEYGHQKMADILFEAIKNML